MKKNFAYLRKEASLLSDSVQNIEPYSPTSSRDKIETSKSNLEPLKLDWNESTIAPSPKVKEALKKALLENDNMLNWYPELFSESLRSKLSEYTGRKHNEILVTNGSDDALELICKTFLDPEDQVVTQYPTYTHFFIYVESRGAILKKATPENVFENNISCIIEKITPATKLIYITNPNNPTGVLLTEREIETICTFATNSIVIVDEAYVEFAGMSVQNLIDTHHNLIITRTFSKAWGLAGLRIGYILSSAGIISSLSRIFNPKSVNIIAQTAALAALDDVEYMKRYVKDVQTSKRMLKSFFDNHDIHAVNGRGNYIMVQHPELSRLVEEMEKENIFVRDRSSFSMLPNYFRINLGTVSQTEDLIKRLESVLRRLENHN